MCGPRGQILVLGAGSGEGRMWVRSRGLLQGEGGWGPSTLTLEIIFAPLSCDMQTDGRVRARFPGARSRDGKCIDGGPRGQILEECG